MSKKKINENTSDNVEDETNIVLPDLNGDESTEDNESTEEGDNEPEEGEAFPKFGEINIEDDPEPEEDNPEPDSNSLVAMLVNKKFHQLKLDVEEIVANKIASKIQDKKDKLRDSGLRIIGNIPTKPENEEEPDDNTSK